MTEQQRKKAFGRIWPTVFVRAVFDLVGYSEFVISSALRGVYLALGMLIGVKEKDAARFKPKGEQAKRLCESTIKDMREFNETGTGEEDFRIITPELHKVLTRYPCLSLPAKRYGLIIRGVMLDGSAGLMGIDSVAVNTYLQKVRADDNAALILDLRNNQQRHETERQKERDAWNVRQQRHRERVRELSMNEPLPQPMPAARPASTTTHAETPTAPTTPQPSAEVVTEVADKLKARYPIKAANPDKLHKAVAVALTRISKRIGKDVLIAARELIAALDGWCTAKERAKTKKVYYPNLVKWLEDCTYDDAPFDPNAFCKDEDDEPYESSGCGPCGVEIV